MPDIFDELAPDSAAGGDIFDQVATPGDIDPFSPDQNNLRRVMQNFPNERAQRVWDQPTVSREELIKRQTWKDLSAADKLAVDAIRLERGFKTTAAALPKGFAVHSAGQNPYNPPDVMGLGAPVTAQNEALSQEWEDKQSAMTGEQKQAEMEASSMWQLGKSIEKTIPESPQPSNVNRPFGAAAEGAGSLGASMSMAPLGVAPMMSGMFLMELSDAYESEIARQQDTGEPLNPGKASAKASLYAAGAIPLEYIGGAGRLARRWFGAAAENEVRELARKGGWPAVKMFFEQRAVDVVAESGTEGLQRLWQDAIVHGKPNIAATLQEMGSAAGGTLLLGGGIHGSRAAAIKASNAYHEARSNENIDRVLQESGQQIALEQSLPPGFARTIDPAETRGNVFDIFDEVASESQSPQETAPASSGLVTKVTPAAAAATPAPAGASPEQATQVRTELEALPGGMEDIARPGGKPPTVEQALSNLTGVVADLQAALVANQGNALLKPSGQPDATEKPAQTITGSNVQTGTEMPVQAKPGAAIPVGQTPVQPVATPATPNKPTFAVGREVMDLPTQDTPLDVDATMRAIHEQERSDAAKEAQEKQWEDQNKAEQERGITEQDGILFALTGNGVRLPYFAPGGTVMANYTRLKKKLRRNGILSSDEKQVWNKVREQVPENYEDEFGVDGELLKEAYAAAQEAGIAAAVFKRTLKGSNLRFDVIRSNLQRETGKEYSTRELLEEVIRASKSHIASKNRGRAGFEGLTEAEIASVQRGEQTEVAKSKVLEDFDADETEASPAIEQQQAIVDRLAARNPGLPELKGLRAVGVRNAGAKVQLRPGHSTGTGGKPGLPSAATAELAQLLERLYDLNIIFVDSAGALPFNGVKFVGTKTVLIHVRAGKPMLTVAGHELLHHIKETHLGLYAELVATVGEMDIAGYRSRLTDPAYAGKSDAQITEELLADLMGDSLADPTFLKSLAQQDPNLFKRFARIAIVWLDKLLDKLKGVGFSRYNVDEHIADIEAARDALRTMLVEAAKETQYRKAGIGEDVVAQESDENPFSKEVESEAAQARRGELVAYHGSPEGTFQTFNESDRGIFFTNKTGLAEGYTYRRGLWRSPGKSPKVYAARLTMTNPLVIEAGGARHNNIPFPGQEYKRTVFGNLPANAVSVEQAAARAFALGHDGVIIRDVMDSPDATDKTRSSVYVVKTARQIRPSGGAQFSKDRGDDLFSFDAPESVAKKTEMPSRFALRKPILGQGDTAIVGYEWRSRMGEKWSNREGGLVDARVSDWDNADESTGTGRAIVHVFYVRHADGSIKPEGIRSAQNVLGFNEARLMTIAKKERAAQEYAAEQERLDVVGYDKIAADTPAEAARINRKNNYSPMRTFEENDAIFYETALFEKGGKYVRRNEKTAERMERFGWSLVIPDPAKAARIVLGQPESVSEQKSRLADEKRKADEAKAKAAMLDKAQSRLTGADVDTTKEMFGAEVRQDKSGQGALFSKPTHADRMRDMDAFQMEDPDVQHGLDTLAVELHGSTYAELDERTKYLLRLEYQEQAQAPIPGRQQPATPARRGGAVDRIDPPATATQPLPSPLPPAAPEPPPALTDTPAQFAAWKRARPQWRLAMENEAAALQRAPRTPSGTVDWKRASDAVVRTIWAGERARMEEQNGLHDILHASGLSYADRRQYPSGNPFKMEEVRQVQRQASAFIPEVFPEITLPYQPVVREMNRAGALFSKERHEDFDDGKTTSIKNAKVDQEREDRGLPPAMQPAKRAFGVVWDEAMAIADSQPTRQDALIESLKENPRAATDIEDALLLHRQVDLQNEYSKILARMDKAAGHPELASEIVGLKDQAAFIRQKLHELYDINKAVGTANGRGLNARRMMVREDFSLARMEYEARTLKGKPLTEAETAEITKLQKRIEELELQALQAEGRVSEQEVARRIDAAIAEYRKKQPQYDKRVLVAAENITKQLSVRAEPAKARLHALFNRGGLKFSKDRDDAPVSDVTKDLGAVGAAMIAKDGLDRDGFDAAMVAEFGDGVEKHLEAAWAEANRQLEKFLSSAGTDVKKAVRAGTAKPKVQGKGRVEATIERVKTAQKKGILADTLADFVRSISRGLVEQSPDITRDELVDGVKKELDAAGIVLERRDVMDAISGYGIYHQLSKDEVSIRLRDLKGQLQQVAKLEDLQAKQPLQKTGVERREPSDEERRLIKQVEEGKRRFGVVVSDPETQLKSALDARKTALRNQISDLQFQIDNRKKIVKTKTPLKRDAELDMLQTMRDALRETFVELFPQDGESKILAEQARLERQIKERESVLASGSPGAPPKMVNRPAEPRIEKLRQKLESINAAIAAERKARNHTREKELERQKLRLEKALSSAEATLAAGAPVKERVVEKNRPLAPGLEQVQQKLEAVRAAIAAERKKQAVGYRRMLERRIAEYQHRMETGDFATKKQVKTPQQNPEVLKLRAQVEQVKIKWLEMKAAWELANRDRAQVVVDALKQAAFTARNIKTAFDVSAPGRQGIWTALAHPVLAARNLPVMFRALLREQSAQEIDQEIQARRNSTDGTYHQSKLYLAPMNATSLTAMEEAIMGRWAQKIPGVRASNRAYVTFLNRIRADVFDSILAAEDAKNPLTKEDKIAIANLVNVATGRGNVGKSAGGMTAAAQVLFSPRLLVSRFQLVGGQPFYHATPRARRIIAKEYAKTIGAASAIIFLAALAGFDVEDDPRSTDFLKLKDGNTRVDILGGLPNIIIFLARMFSGEKLNAKGETVPLRESSRPLNLVRDVPLTDKPKFGQDDAADVVFRFGRTKAAPVVGGVLDFASGVNVVGEKITPASALYNQFAPLIIGDVADAWKEHNAPKALLYSTLTMFGFGTQTYEARQKEKK